MCGLTQNMIYMINQKLQESFKVLGNRKGENVLPLHLKRQFHKVVKHTQTIAYKLF